MATRNIVPRANEEGNIGTALKNWLKGWFKNIFVSGDITDGTNTVIVSDISDSVDKKHEHLNKEIVDLIEEALTSALKIAYDDAVTKAHEHSNKDILDLVEESLTSALKTAYDDAVTKAHAHTNKVTLDLIEEAFTTILKNKLDGIESGAVALETVKADSDISDAITKKHAHDNKATLDLIEEAFTTVLKDKLDGVVNPMLFKGEINIPGDFPTSAAVQNGWTYRIKTDVSDNDPTKTNTDQSFLEDEEISWNGTDWTSLGFGAVKSVNGETGIVTLNQDDIEDGTTYKQYSDTEKSKLAAVEESATADQTDEEIQTAAKADSDISDAISKKHTQGTDQKLDDGGGNEVGVADVKDAVDKKHASGSDDQDLSGLVEKVADKSLVADIEIAKIHTQGTDQKLDDGGGNEVTVAEIKGIVDNGLKNVVEDTAPQLGGELDSGAHTIGFTQQALTVVSNACAIDWKIANKASLAVDDDVTVSFTNPSNPCSLTLKIVQDGSGGHTVSLPATIKWSGGSAPTLSTGANDIDIISLYFDGSVYYGVASLDFATA